MILLVRIRKAYQDGKKEGELENSVAIFQPVEVKERRKKDMKTYPKPVGVLEKIFYNISYRLYRPDIDRIIYSHPEYGQ